MLFCGGLAKSGTTFLQRCLDLHPDIGCKSEDNINFLKNKLLGIKDQYNQVLQKTAVRIGSNNCNLLDKTPFINTLPILIKEIAINRNNNKKCIGIQDNDFLIENLIYILNNFNDWKIIIIHRNPIDTALSAWDHNLKLYKKENDIMHLDILKTNEELDIDKYATRVSKYWNKKMIKVIEVAKNNSSKVKLISYESLVTNKKETISDLFYFLDCDCSKDVLTDIIKKSTIERMRSESSDPSFFSKGRISFGEGILKPSTISNCINISKATMIALGIVLPGNREY